AAPAGLHLRLDNDAGLAGRDDLGGDRADLFGGRGDLTLLYRNAIGSKKLLGLILKQIHGERPCLRLLPAEPEPSGWPRRQPSPVRGPGGAWGWLPANARWPARRRPTAPSGPSPLSRSSGRLA